jgi:hypothetical protein
MNWIYVVLVVAAAVAALRVAVIFRRARSGEKENWDARMVRDLRASGANAFTPYEVDFFFTLPNEQACSSVRKSLELEGFTTDARVQTDLPDGEAFSLHASKRLRVTADGMHEYSERFHELATQLGGHYDGWTTDPSRV